MLSLEKRHLKTPKHAVNEKSWKKAALSTMKHYNRILQPVGYKEVIMSFSGVKRNRYRTAYYHLMTTGRANTRVKMFVKQDKMEEAKLKIKPPRAIQYRSPEFNLEFMRYIKPIEDYVYNDMTAGVVSNTQVITKCLNPSEKAQLFLTKISHFKNPKFYSCDHAQFDSCIMKCHLETTHDKYLQMIPSAEFARLCQVQIENVGKTRGGIKYSVTGTRMSGDADTSLGNCLVNIDCILAVLERSGILKYDIMVDGDDSIIIVEGENSIDVTGFAELGFDTEVSSTDDEMQVTFCQQRLCFDGQDYTFLRNPIRAISHYGICLKNYTDKQLRMWQTGIGMCENALYGQYPIYNAIARNFITTERIIVDEDSLRRLGSVEMSRELKTVTLDARLSLFHSWGLSLEVQQMFEDDITTSIESSNRTNHDESMARAWQRFSLCHESSSSCWGSCS